MLLVFIIYNQHFDRFWFQKSGHIRNDFVWNLDDGRVAFYLFGIVLCNDLTVGIGLAVKTALKGFVKNAANERHCKPVFENTLFAVHIVDFTAVKRNHKTALFRKTKFFCLHDRTGKRAAGGDHDMVSGCKSLFDRLTVAGRKSLFVGKERSVQIQENCLGIFFFFH